MSDYISREDVLNGRIWVQTSNGVEISHLQAVPVGYIAELPPAQPEYLHVIMEKIRKNYEKAMNVSYINDPMAVALSETWKEYVDEKEHKRG